MYNEIFGFVIHVLILFIHQYNRQIPSGDYPFYHTKQFVNCMKGRRARDTAGYRHHK